MRKKQARLFSVAVALLMLVSLFGPPGAPLLSGRAEAEQVLPVLPDPIPLYLVGLHVSALTDTTSSLAWAPTPGAVKYRVWVNDVLIAEAPSNQYTLTQLSPNSFYGVTVAAVAADGREGMHTDGAFATLLATPTGLQASAVAAAGVRIVWDPVPDAVRYRVFLDGVPIAEPATNAYEFSALNPVTTYMVGVAAIDEYEAVGPSTGY